MRVKRIKLTHMEIAQICRELAVLLHAGVMLGDGLSLLAQEAGGPLGELLGGIGRRVDGGQTLAAALRQSRAPQCRISLLLRERCVFSWFWQEIPCHVRLPLTA